MEEQIKRIIDGRHVMAVLIWPSGTRFLGCLMDSRVKQISGSTTWNTSATINDVLDSLERAANTYRAIKDAKQ